MVKQNLKEYYINNNKKCYKNKHKIVKEKPLNKKQTKKIQMKLTLKYDKEDKEKLKEFGNLFFFCIQHKILIWGVSIWWYWVGKRKFHYHQYLILIY